MLLVRLSIFVTAIFAGLPLGRAAHSQDLLVGNWIQSVNGERMRIEKDGQVVFSPVVGTDEVRGTLSVGAAAEGGNITIKVGTSHVCVYRATLLKQAQAVNLKLLNGEAA
jgi:hypothetical protein